MVLKGILREDCTDEGHGPQEILLVVSNLQKFDMGK